MSRIDRSLWRHIFIIVLLFSESGIPEAIIILWQRHQDDQSEAGNLIRFVSEVESFLQRRRQKICVPFKHLQFIIKFIKNITIWSQDSTEGCWSDSHGQVSRSSCVSLSTRFLFEF